MSGQRKHHSFSLGVGHVLAQKRPSSPEQFFYYPWSRVLRSIMWYQGQFAVEFIFKPDPGYSFKPSILLWICRLKCLTEAGSLHQRSGLDHQGFLWPLASTYLVLSNHFYLSPLFQYCKESECLLISYLTGMKHSTMHYMCLLRKNHCILKDDFYVKWISWTKGVIIFCSFAPEKVWVTGKLAVRCHNNESLTQRQHVHLLFWRWPKLVVTFRDEIRICLSFLIWFNNV